MGLRRVRSRVAAHADLAARQIQYIYLACVVSQLTYGLQTAVLGKAAKKKVDAFHARCARNILGISPSYCSRVSNASVLQQLDATPLSCLLLAQQLGYFGKLARRPATCPARQLVFDEDLSLKSADSVKRRGRPRLEWASEVYKTARSLFENETTFHECILDSAAWRIAIREYCRA